jgi:hypothetical protein
MYAIIDIFDNKVREMLKNEKNDYEIKTHNNSNNISNNNSTKLRNTS